MRGGAGGTYLLRPIEKYSRNKYLRPQPQQQQQHSHSVLAGRARGAGLAGRGVVEGGPSTAPEQVVVRAALGDGIGGRPAGGTGSRTEAAAAAAVLVRRARGAGAAAGDVAVRLAGAAGAHVLARLGACRDRMRAVAAGDRVDGAVRDELVAPAGRAVVGAVVDGAAPFARPPAPLEHLCRPLALGRCERAALAARVRGVAPSAEGGLVRRSSALRACLARPGPGHRSAAVDVLAGGALPVAGPARGRRG